MKVMYLDSGDHSLEKIDASYPVFVLGGVIVDRAYARTVIDPQLREMKEEYFGRDDIILHTADLVRAKNGFEDLKDPAKRARFYEALNVKMREFDYSVVACVTKKDELLAQYGANAGDPYMYSLRVVVELFCRELGNSPDGGFICAEKRGFELDRELDRAWSHLIRHGTSFIAARDIDERIVDLGLKDKALNIAGLQLADLVVSPIGRAVMGKPTREDWKIVESKFRQRGGQYQGYGLVVRPT